MVSPSCLTDPHVRLVIDSSAAINLTATGRATEIVSALPNEIVVVDTVIAELEQGRRKGRPHAELLAQLVAGGHVNPVSLDTDGSADFEDLVIGPAAHTLDDGEAATLAFAANGGDVPIIDEQKAARICEHKYPTLLTGCTVDLFAHRSVEDALGREALSEAVYNALVGARMRVLPHHVDWVITLIGHERAAACTSLSRHVRGKLQVHKA